MCPAPAGGHRYGHGGDARGHSSGVVRRRSRAEAPADGRVSARLPDAVEREAGDEQPVDDRRPGLLNNNGRTWGRARGDPNRSVAYMRRGGTENYCILSIICYSECI